jgi:phospholipase/lecithinase/hemolysin
MPALRFLVAWLALACLTPSVSALPYDAVVIYGDSLSDNGNLFAVTTAIGQPLPPSPPYYDGRRSNGPVAVEYLAQSLNAPLADFAWIGATTGIGNYGDAGTVTTLGGLNLPGMTTTYDATKSLLTPYLSNGLFIVWGGANDLLAPSPPDSGIEINIINRAVANEVAIITDLQIMGTKTILAPGMLDLGLTPYFNSLGPLEAAKATAFSDIFNATLMAALPSDVLYFDTAGLMRQVVNNPAAYGFTNSNGVCFDGITVCSLQSEYVFFDDFHPTTASHALLAQGFYAAVVPEPYIVLMLLTGAGLLAWQRKTA